MNEKFTMDRVGLSVTLACNLNCRLCAAYAPYQRSVAMDLYILKKTLEQYFSITSFVESFGITGGEPLLYVHMPELFDELLNYLEQIGEIRIFTNGTIIPKIELLNVLAQYGNKFSFLIDNYGEHLSTNIPEICETLENGGIRYEVRDYCSEGVHCGGWVDFGDVREKKHSPESAKELFSKCAFPSKLHFCFTIFNGIMRPCGTIGRRLSLGLDVNSNEYIDLFDEKMTVEDQRRKIMDIYNANCLDTCAYCNGLCEDSVRFKPAEQLSKEELENIRKGIILR